MWVEGDIGGNESWKIAMAWSRKENIGRGGPLESTQLACGRTSSTRKAQAVVEKYKSGGYEEARNH